MPKLKEHILPRIRNMHLKEAASNTDTKSSQPGLLSSKENDTAGFNHASVLFKNDCLYSHQLARFNYTTYDVRRSQDVINPDTPHCDIMALADTDHSGLDGTGSDHTFLYGRVLGIYHVNVVYTGEDMVDYSARRVEFLWVRWFQYVGLKSVAWKDLRLDAVDFPPMASEGAFGFLDPSHVLRGCHIIPAFASGRARLDGVGLSHCARDAHDWSRYYVNRYDIHEFNWSGYLMHRFQIC